MAHVNPLVERWHRGARDDPEVFWGRRRADQVHWSRRWEPRLRVRLLNFPFRWFVGGQTKMAYNCVDYHLTRGADDRIALTGLNERGERRVLTYAELSNEVHRTHRAALRGLGIARGDRDAIYMPTTCVGRQTCSMLPGIFRGHPHGGLAGFGSRRSGRAHSPVRGRRPSYVGTSQTERARTFRSRASSTLRRSSQPSAAGGRPPARAASMHPLHPNCNITWTQFLHVLLQPEHRHALAGGAMRLPPSWLPRGTTATPKLAVQADGSESVYIHAMARKGAIPTSGNFIRLGRRPSYIVYAPLLIGCTTIAYEGRSITRAQRPSKIIKKTV